jgi:exodeoxyribonuclease V alpha subunit
LWITNRVIIKARKGILVIDDSVLKQALTEELQAGNLIEDTIGEEQLIFLIGFYNYEKNIAIKLNLLAKDQPLWNSIDTDRAIDWMEQKLSIKLADNQKDAIQTVIKSKVTVITGGPGNGKTTLLNSYN